MTSHPGPNSLIAAAIPDIFSVRFAVSHTNVLGDFPNFLSARLSMHAVLIVRGIH